MTLEAMLEAARALHDRDPINPGNCATCRGDGMQEFADWPCPTAIALGATGRSEWAAPEPDPAFCGAISDERDGAPMLGGPEIVHADLPCTLDAGHASQHQDKNGDCW